MKYICIIGILILIACDDLTQKDYSWVFKTVFINHTNDTVFLKKYSESRLIKEDTIMVNDSLIDIFQDSGPKEETYISSIKIPIQADKLIVIKNNKENIYLYDSTCEELNLFCQEYYERSKIKERSYLFRYVFK